MGISRPSVLTIASPMKTLKQGYSQRASSLSRPLTDLTLIIRLTTADTVVLITAAVSDVSDLVNTLKQLPLPPFVSLLSVGAAPLQLSPCDLCMHFLFSQLLMNSAISFILSSLGGVDAPCFQELALKLALNAITTGAHILKGKIFENRMIGVIHYLSSLLSSF